MADDFASAVLVSMVERALRDDGSVGVVNLPTDALLPLQDKRRVVEAVAAAHGLLPLLRVGRVIPQLPPHPVVTALRAAEGPVDLFARWSRLERFAHSRHRVVLHDAGRDHLVAEHVGPPGSPPGAAEDALVLGVLIGLLQDMGVEGLTVTLDSGVAVLAEGRLDAPPPGAPTARWRVGWSSHGRRPRPRGAGGGTGPTEADAVARARVLIADDLARPWTVGDLAICLDVSVRTLQRRLRDAGGHAGLLGAVRTEHAAELLAATDHPLSVIGFACGFADQPHFTRTFRRRTAMTPAAYRSAFTRLDSHRPAGPGRSS